MANTAVAEIRPTFTGWVSGKVLGVVVVSTALTFTMPGLNHHHKTESLISMIVPFLQLPLSTRGRVASHNSFVTEDYHPGVTATEDCHPVTEDYG